MQAGIGVFVAWMAMPASNYGRYEVVLLGLEGSSTLQDHASTDVPHGRVD